MNSTFRFLIVLAAVLATVPLFSSWVGDRDAATATPESLVVASH